MLTMLTNIYSIVISIVATRSGEILDPSATLGMTVAGKLTNIYKKSTRTCGCFYILNIAKNCLFDYSKCN